MTVEIRYFGTCPNDHTTGVIVTDSLDRDPEKDPFFCPICELPMKMSGPPDVTDVVHEELLPK